MTAPAASLVTLEARRSPPSALRLAAFGSQGGALLLGPEPSQLRFGFAVAAALHLLDPEAS